MNKTLIFLVFLLAIFLLAVRVRVHPAGMYSHAIHIQLDESGVIINFPKMIS